MPPAHLHPRHPTSRITQLHLASRGISPIRAARRALRALQAMAHATARSPVAPCARRGHLRAAILLLLYLIVVIIVQDYIGASPSQHRIARFTTNAEDSCEPNAISPPETLSVSARCWVYHPQHIERSLKVPPSSPMAQGPRGDTAMGRKPEPTVKILKDQNSIQILDISPAA